MKLPYRWPTILACLVIIGLSGWLWSLPLAQIAEGPRPDLLGAHHVALEPGVVLRQTFALPTPAPRDVAIRCWAQRVAIHQPALRIRVESDEQVLGAVTAPLLPADGAVHMRQTPWLQLPAGAQQLTVIVEGQGVQVATTAVDRVAGGALEINNVSHAPNDLALQLVSGDLGIERYLPLARIVEGKPGILAWIRYPLVLFLLYLGATITLLRSPLRLLRWLEDAPDAPAAAEHRQS